MLSVMNISNKCHVLKKRKNISIFIEAQMNFSSDFLC